jgi:hypothetical protein
MSIVGANANTNTKVREHTAKLASTWRRSVVGSFTRTQRFLLHLGECENNIEHADLQAYLALSVLLYLSICPRVIKCSAEKLVDVSSLALACCP